jgi:outer membrane protein assembly factor BamB
MVRWVLDDVYLLWNSHETTIDAALGIICFLGDIGQRTQYGSVNCIYSSTGNLSWRQPSRLHDSLNISPSGVIVAYQSPASVRSFDLNNGGVNWRKRLGGNGLIYLDINDNQIQVLAYPEFFWQLNFEGGIIDQFPRERLFAIRGNVKYRNLSGIQAKNSLTSEIIWEYWDPDLILSPLFTENQIILRSGYLGGNAYALDRKTGALLWSVSGAIGNPVYSLNQNVVYVLCEDGSLKSVQIENGEQDIVGKFSPAPFVIGGVESYHYGLAYDAENDLLMVYLGDSRQLIALSTQVE